MDVKIQQKIVKDYVSKSNLPTADYVINPYVGCAHACQYCYASFMKRFTKHEEPWGAFVDVKMCDKKIDTKKLVGKSVFLSSVTDPYQPIEVEYELTRHILKQLVGVDCQLGISTKSKLILRDIDLLKQCKHLQVSMSIQTLDESFKDDMDCASSIEERLQTLKTLHEAGIYTVLFMSPMFPGITDFKAIIDVSKTYIDEYWFENLNLRGSYKHTIMAYIKTKYAHLLPLYEAIYARKDMTYWQTLSLAIKEYCEAQGVHYTNFFYHTQLVQEKLAKNKQREQAQH